MVRSPEAVMLAADLCPADPVDLTLTGQKKTQGGTTEVDHTLKQEHPFVSVMVTVVRAHAIWRLEHNWHVVTDRKACIHP